MNMSLLDHEDILCRIPFYPYDKTSFDDWPMPLSLSSHMSNSEWMSFYEELDKVRESELSESRRCLRMFLALIGLLTFSEGFFFFNSEFWDSEFWYLSLLVLFGPLLVFSCMPDTRHFSLGSEFDHYECILSNQNAKSSNIFFYREGRFCIVCSTTKRSVI
jgi:hypothetical protein